MQCAFIYIPEIENPTSFISQQERSDILLHRPFTQYPNRYAVTGNVQTIALLYRNTILQVPRPIKGILLTGQSQKSASGSYVPLAD